MVKLLKLGVLASGGGTNLQAIIDRISTGELPVELRAVISNNSKSGALERARHHGIPAIHLSSYHHPAEEELDKAIVGALRQHKVELVAFAGYMKKRGPAFLEAFTNRVLNIHPALLPRFGGSGMYGVRVHEAVLRSGDPISGCTVHLVDEEYDHGPILAQRYVPVLPHDTPESLAARVLEQEHQLYPEVLLRIAVGDIDLDAAAQDLRPEPTVGALIFNDQGELFLMKSHKWKDLYTLPGGHIEPGETAREALLREIREETGLVIERIGFLRYFDCIYPPQFHQRRHFLFLDFCCKATSDRVALGSEAEAYVWISPHQALSLPLEPFTRGLIESYLQREGICWPPLT